MVCSLTAGAMPVRIFIIYKEAYTLHDGMNIGVLSTNIDKDEGAEVEQEGDVKILWSGDALISHHGLNSLLGPRSFTTGSDRSHKCWAMASFMFLVVPGQLQWSEKRR